MANEVMLTKEGKLKLELRLDELEKVKRLEVAEKIKEARSFGDLSENAEYDAAKEEQAIIESEIVEITKKLQNCLIIDEENIDTRSVNVGCYVKIQYVATAEKVEYQIVGSTEIDIEENKISNECAIGKALIGKKKNEMVNVNLPNNTTVQIKIIGIRV